MNRTQTTDERLILPVEQLDMPLLASGGYLNSPRARSSERRSHEAFCVTYQVSREIHLCLEDHAILRIHRGQMGIIQPGVAHQGRWGTVAPNAHFWFRFQPEAPGAARFTPFTESFLGWAAQILRTAGNTARSAPPILEALCNKLNEHLSAEDIDDLSLACIRSLVVQIFLAAIEGVRSEGRAPRYSLPIHQAIQLIHGRLQEQMSIPEIAREVGLSTDRLQRKFKQETGESPWSYILYQRCWSACEELGGTDRSVTDIARRLGFASSQHFATSFKATIGLTPTQFRRKTESTSLGRSLAPAVEDASLNDHHPG